MSIEIVKVQRSLLKKAALAIVSPRDRVERVTHQKLDAAAERAMNGIAKAFFKASFVDGKWKLGRKVRDEDW